jgi:hypothetical protein
MPRDLVNEIKSLKSRSEYNSRLDFSSRLGEIEGILSQAEKLRDGYDKELLKYIPIATVACFESFFRTATKEIIDYGKPFSDNIAKLNQTKSLKLDFNFLNEIQSKTITIGEFISHILPCNNFEDINTNLSIIAGINFSSELKRYKDHSKFDGRNSISSYFCDNYDRIITDVRRFFELRHIFCHEFAISFNIDRKEIYKCFERSKYFLNQANFYIWHLLYPDAPETQAEMNAQAGVDFANAEKILKEICDRVMMDFGDDAQTIAQFKDSMDKWEVYRESKAKLEAIFVEGGTLYPLIYLSSQTKTTKAKIEDLISEYKIKES